MSTKIALFKEGEIAQVGTPLDLYTNPIDLEAADFIGNPRINFIEGTAFYDGNEMRVLSELGEYHFVKERIKEEEEFPKNTEFPCVLGIRPEMVEIEGENSGRKHSIEATVYASQPGAARR